MSTLGTIRQLSRSLEKMLGWLDKAAAHGAAKKFDPVTLLSARLAPDQYPLVRQYQSACDTAKLGAARLAGKEAPKHADTEQTVDEIRTRVRAVIEYLNAFTEADFAGADARMITPAFFPPGKGLPGADYLTQFVVPNFYFHVSMAYAILRHNGVDLGKMDFIALDLVDV